MHETISVVIPTYNSAGYICEAIDSVLNQTCSDYEILVIDDGSTDNTGVLVQSRYPAIRYIRTENKGVSHARNLGISKARGELIAFLDADDRWMPEKIEKQAALFQADKTIGMVFTENYFFNEQGVSAFTANKRSRLMRGNIVRNIFLNSYVVTSTVMVRKSVFDRVGLFEEELAVAEDDNMWMRIGMKHRIELLDERLVQYRMTAGSLSSDFKAIVTGVNRQIQILQTRYPDLYDTLGSLAIRKKYAELYFSEAYRDFNQGRYSASRTRFIDSYINYPFSLRSLFYYLSTYLPSQSIQMIRGMKRCATKSTA